MDPEDLNAVKFTRNIQTPTSKDDNEEEQRELLEIPQLNFLTWTIFKACPFWLEIYFNILFPYCFADFMQYFNSNINNQVIIKYYLILQAVVGDQSLSRGECNSGLVLPPPAIPTCHGVMSSIQAIARPLSDWSIVRILASDWSRQITVSGSWINILIVKSGNSEQRSSSKRQ